jgi:hypothetical protein
MFRAQAERVIFRIRGDLNRGADLARFSPFSNQVDDRSDQVWPDAKALQNFLVLVQDVLCDEPHEVFFLCPSVENVGTGVSPRDERFSEARYASH